MSGDDKPLDQADTAAADEPASLASASTAVESPPRSPSQRALHDDVHKALFSDEPPVRPETGKVFAGRYRIEQKLGQGGMGEVFRARDLVLEEEVAIKLLPRTLAARPGYYERFVQEVRLARQVSHPSVCRVHDIGEVDGQPFISMEYVDGEDLASLLRRIGRLGEEKAVELAHQLCTGLDALHEKGIIHRDLKPSNIMLDGDGRIRIADFGLASVADELREHEIRDGTPAYQAPEQKEGREATVRSDVYALGLVLREMFLGKGPGRSGTQSSTATSETALDPAITETIARCLQEDPAQRPATALAVAAALPGGDPLAAALAAGRLPSPEAVANAATVGGISSTVASVLLFATLAALALLAIFTAHKSALGLSEELLPPALLERDAVAIADALQDNPDVLSASTLQYDASFIEELDGEEEDLEGRLRDFSVFRYRYRHGVAIDDAPLRVEQVPVTEPGDLEVVVDGRGRLVGLTRIPFEGPAADEVELVDGQTGWDFLLAAAKVDPADLEPAEPTKVPPVYADELRAWTTMYGQTAVVIHAGLRDEMPVWFSAARADAVSKGGIHVTGVRGLAFLILFLVFVVVAVFALGSMIKALREVSSATPRKDWDHRGARVLALFVLVSEMLGWVLGVRGPELFTVWFFVLEFAGKAAVTWVAYLVLEPYARANWPQTLVSWNRLLQGRFRDPMVGRDALIGALFGVVLILLFYVDGKEFSAFGTSGLLGPRHAVAVVPDAASSALSITLALFLALISLQRIFRRRAVAVAIFLGFVPSMMLLVQGTLEQILISAAVGAGAAFIMLRYGVLAMVFGTFTALLCVSLPIATGFESAWWSGTGVFGLVIVAGMALVGSRLATAPQRARPG